ncbi:hypothetical protein GCM10009603_26250 [Nocardiopsis exhalans]
MGTKAAKQAFIGRPWLSWHEGEDHTRANPKGTPARFAPIQLRYGKCYESERVRMNPPSERGHTGV